MSCFLGCSTLAYPDKTFNTAKTLFKTKDFYSLDQRRFVLDQSARNHYSIGLGLNYKNRIYEEERIKTCDDAHRSQTLEGLTLAYQLFKKDGISEEEAESRQKAVWKILDEHYEKLPYKTKESEADKAWKLCLARMDRRKMEITTENQNGKTLIKFNPEIEPDLKAWSEKSLKASSEPMKYGELRMWADYRRNNDEKYKKYLKYEDNPSQALEDTKRIVLKLRTTKKRFQTRRREEDSFYLFNNSIPADVCAVLIRDFFDRLSGVDREFCKDIVIGYAELASKFNYQYQVADGSESAISVLPILLEKYPKEKKRIKEILLLTLFNTYPINMAGTHFNVFAIRAISQLWEKHFDYANSLLLGYLILKPKYVALIERVRQESYDNGNYEFDEKAFHERFYIETEKDLHNILDNEVSLDDLNDIESIKPYILVTAFQLIPLKISSQEHEEIVNSIISIFAHHLLSSSREERIEYESRQRFLERLSYLILEAPKEKIPVYLKPFLDEFNGSGAIAELFQEFILAADRLGAYDNFWQVWDLFKNRVIELCKDSEGYWQVDEIIRSYLFAKSPWKENVTDWHILKNENSTFFEEISKKMGHCPSSLYSISKLLNDIGAKFLDNGVIWLYGILNNNRDLWNSKLEVNTIYYIENAIRKFIYEHHEKVRRTKELKQKILVILDFLTERGSVVGYMLREKIL